MGSKIKNDWIRNDKRKIRLLIIIRTIRIKKLNNWRWKKKTFGITYAICW